ncbi:mercury methylation corrinoid protein HgcA [uncultured Methanoregula sp.]|uniref:mercury methylation corrinoid protein HgcA n=1 Tax=uncultured Methanoregula sp. TaxID=1005933 RepID=UPI002AAA69FD|nr:mercury methylation corrinoid protein HgcA [uncultured Methanoregula sp.]
MEPEKTERCGCSNETAAPGCGCQGKTIAPAGIRTTDSIITMANRFDHFLARWAVRRGDHRVEPGLYRLGNPTPDSPVFVSANYTLSFDALRSALGGRDSYILVLDTKGINVWCAAGKGTFGTEELVRRIEVSGLDGIVRHRKLILPQLGAPGVSWPEVMRKTGFGIEYGPVRARDLPEYLKSHKATPEMRQVTFPLWDRMVLIPVELAHIALPALAAALALWFLAEPAAGLAAVVAVVAGTVLFPILLPVLPTHDFSTKGLILGIIVALPFAILWGGTTSLPWWARAAGALTPLLIIPAVTAYLALNFTGSTTFTSRTGVKKEIYRYVPVMVLMAGAGMALGIILGLCRLMGWA